MQCMRKRAICAPCLRIRTLHTDASARLAHAPHPFPSVAPSHPACEDTPLLRLRAVPAPGMPSACHAVVHVKHFPTRLCHAGTCPPAGANALWAQGRGQGQPDGAAGCGLRRPRAAGAAPDHQALLQGRGGRAFCVGYYPCRPGAPRVHASVCLCVFLCACCIDLARVLTCMSASDCLQVCGPVCVRAWDHPTSRGACRRLPMTRRHACCPATQAKMRATPGMLAGDCVAIHDGHEYAVPTEPLHEAWQAGLLPLLQGPMELAQALRAAMRPVQQAMMDAKMEAAAAAATAAAAPPPKLGAAASLGGTERLSTRLSTTGASGALGLPGDSAPPPFKLPRAYVELACVYVVADVATRDVRLREREGGPLEEQDLQVRLCWGWVGGAQSIRRRGAPKGGEGRGEQGCQLHSSQRVGRCMSQTGGKCMSQRASPFGGFCASQRGRRRSLRRGGAPVVEGCGHPFIMFACLSRRAEASDQVRWLAEAIEHVWENGACTHAHIYTRTQTQRCTHKALFPFPCTDMHTQVHTHTCIARAARAAPWGGRGRQGDGRT